MRLINANVNSLNLRRLLLGFFILCQVATVAGQEITESFIVDELARTQSDPDSAISLAINAPRDFVFDFLTRRVHEYVSDARAVEFDHDSSVQAKQLGVGSERRIIMASDEFLLQRFLIIEPPSSFAYFVDMERSTLSAPLVYSIFISFFIFGLLFFIFLPSGLMGTIAASMHLNERCRGRGSVIGAVGTIRVLSAVATTLDMIFAGIFFLVTLAAGGKAVGFFVALTMIYGGHGLISIHVFNQSSRVADAVNPVTRGVVVL